MPIYEFKCDECHTIFEELISSSAAMDVVCTHCGSRQVSRILSLCGFTAKGGGGETSRTSTSGSSCSSCHSHHCSHCH